MIFTPLKDIPVFHNGDDLSKILINAINVSGLDLQENDIFVIAQKIVSKCEGRYVNLTQVSPSSRAIELSNKTKKDARLLELVLQESRKILRTKIGIVIVEHKLGFICANAGIDHSNVDCTWGESQDWVLLLPENPDRSARIIREKLVKEYKTNLGVLIIDTHGRAWRNGVVGVTIGLSGVPGVIDMRGTSDIFGYKLNATQIAVSDELAAGASLLMGQAAEMQPVIHIRGFPYELRDSSLKELIREENEDLFR
jgi:coenzyme F420-0:L-glutamate ligase / coenzyme F420-1:gamma-L-glutamate ligase